MKTVDKTILAARLTFLLCVTLLTLAGASAGATSSDDLDIGSPQKSGGTTFHSGVYTISGGGADIWSTRDQFHFNKGTLAGYGTVTAYVQSVGNTNVWAKSGVMLRSDATPGSVFADVVVTPGSGVAFQTRSTAGGPCTNAQVRGVKAPVWVKLSREANGFTGSYSADGVNWTQISKTAPLALPPVALAGVAVTSHNSAALSTSTFTHVAVTPDTDTRYLHTQANEVRDRSNALVTLRGANVGGWLVTEGWMCGQSDAPGSSPANPYYSVDPKNSGRFALEELEARFGPAQAATLINAWRDNWFTDRDLDNLQSYGFNLIRVPFGWRNLQDAQGNWYKDAQGNIDFSRFDWVVQEAAKRGMYVIFDYHVWPGQQQDGGSISQWGEPGETQRAQSSAIWSALASHFAGNGTVAAFDLINEPTGSNDNYAAHRAFYEAVRGADPARMVVVEWVSTGDIAGLGWTNVMCSGHYPAGNKAQLATLVSNLPAHSEFSTAYPCFVGEFRSDDTSNVTGNAADVTQGFDHLGWSWATWTYKTVNQGGWGLFDYDGSVSYNLASDSYSSILTKWTTGLSQWQNPANPVNYYLNSDIIAGLSQGASYARPPLVSGDSYELVNFNSMRTVNSWGGGQGTQVNQYQAPNSQYLGSNDYWLATQVADGNWTFANAAGLLLYDNGAGTAGGTAVVQWPADGTLSQEWRIVSVGDGTFKVINAFSGLDMEVSGGSLNQGGAIDQGPDIPGAAYQRWTFNPLN